MLGNVRIDEASLKKTPHGIHELMRKYATLHFRTLATDCNSADAVRRVTSRSRETLNERGHNHSVYQEYMRPITIIPNMY